MMFTWCRLVAHHVDPWVRGARMFRSIDATAATSRGIVAFTPQICWLLWKPWVLRQVIWPAGCFGSRNGGRKGPPSPWRVASCRSTHARRNSTKRGENFTLQQSSWIPMDRFLWIGWIPMDWHGPLWIATNSYRFLCIASYECHGSPWIPIDSYVDCWCFRQKSSSGAFAESPGLSAKPGGSARCHSQACLRVMERLRRLITW